MYVEFCYYTYSPEISNIAEIIPTGAEPASPPGGISVGPAFPAKADRIESSLPDRTTPTKSESHERPPAWREEQSEYAEGYKYIFPY